MSDVFEKYKHLEGVPFSYEDTQDCLTTAVNCYALWDIDVDNSYARYMGWEYDEPNLFVDNFRNEGFKLVDLEMDDAFYRNLQHGDCLLMSIRDIQGRSNTGQANHCAVYLKPEQDIRGHILHHFYGQLSKIVPYRYRNCTTHVLRHPDMPMQKKSVEKIDFFDMLSPHKREMLLDVRRAVKDLQ